MCSMLARGGIPKLTIPTRTEQAPLMTAAPALLHMADAQLNTHSEHLSSHMASSALTFGLSAGLRINERSERVRE